MLMSLASSANVFPIKPSPQKWKELRREEKQSKSNRNAASNRSNRNAAIASQSAFTCSKLKIETLEQVVKYVQS